MVLEQERAGTYNRPRKEASGVTFRQRILRCLGRFPAGGALHAKVLGRERVGSVVRTLVRYDAEPGEEVRAYLMHPAKWVGNLPGVVAIHQHAGQYYLGKSEPAGLSADGMYHYGIELARRGYCVIAPDQLGFEDRRGGTEVARVENPVLDGMTNERYEFQRRLFHGSTLQAKYLFDLRRAIDFLQGLPFVNAKRIGCIGHSLGGQEALWLSWYDRRIRAGVSSCGFGTYQSYLDHHIMHNFASYVPGILDVGDVDDLVADLAPKPLFASHGTEDGLFPMEGVRRIVERAKEAYSQAGADGKFRHYLFAGGHSFGDDVKVEAYAFLDRHLQR